MTTPAHWPRWHPSSIAVQGAVDHALLMGESVGEEFNVAGWHGHAIWRVVSREADRRWSIEATIDGHVAGS